ncbi:hypothetical protein [Kocuria flava]|uniref:hypothetical protein n=1 Tax=Kocuria flava TaxID=446860 RepID=UPI002F925987
MSCDPSCSRPVRGPRTRAAQGLLTAAVLAAALTACGAGAEEPGAMEAFEADTTGVATTPVDVPAPELESAGPVAADAPEVEAVAAALEAQEAFTPSDPPAGGAAAEPEGAGADSAQQTGQDAAVAAEAAAELDPEAVAAAQESARGPALQEILATLAEFEHQGWEQQGTPVVVGEPVTAPLPAPEEGPDGEAVRVTVCLDSSAVTVVDRDGAVVRGPEKDRRALHNYDLFRQSGQSWQVVQHGFPDDPTC